jgi:hypothetical protein
MTIYHEIPPGEPIVIFKPDSSFTVSEDLRPAVLQLIDILDSSGEPMVYIADVRELTISFADMVNILGFITNKELAVFQHPKLHEIIVVTSSNIAALGAQALGQQQYGGFNAQVFEDMDAALDYSHQCI